MVQTLSVQALADWLADSARSAPLLLDVREVWEFEHCAIPGSFLVPMGDVATRMDELDPERELVCICHHGMRSMRVAAFLEQQGFGKIFNLTGGVDAWARQVDLSMPVY